MKISLLSLIPVLAFAAGTTDGALDFTVAHKAMTTDAIQVDNPYITDGTSKIFLRIPPTWKVIGNAQALDCFPEGTLSEVRLEPFKGDKLLTIDQAGTRDLMQQSTSQLPADAKNVTALPAELNPLPIFGWSTLEASVRYDLLGRLMRRSVMYVSMLPGRVLQLTVIGPDADFDKLHKQARQMLGSWFEPSRDLPPELQRKYASPELGG